MYLLRPASLSSPRLNLERMVFWTQYPGSRQGAISMLEMNVRIRDNVTYVSSLRADRLEDNNGLGLRRS